MILLTYHDLCYVSLTPTSSRSWCSKTAHSIRYRWAAGLERMFLAWSNMMHANSHPLSYLLIICILYIILWPMSTSVKNRDFRNFIIFHYLKALIAKGHPYLLKNQAVDLMVPGPQCFLNWELCDLSRFMGSCYDLNGSIFIKPHSINHPVLMTTIMMHNSNIHFDLIWKTIFIHVERAWYIILAMSYVMLVTRHKNTYG